MGDHVDSDSDVEIETSEEDQEAIMQLEAALESNPRQIKVHLKYISLLRKCKLSQRLRNARVAMREIYPLSIQMWQEWLEDETEALQAKLAAVASGDEVDQDELEEDRDFTLQLFEAATSEYLSVDLWLSYLQFVMSLNTAAADNAEDTVSKVREVGEKALSAAGLHLSQASRLWDAYRAYEQALADAGWGGSGQVDKVRSLFHRQLKVPLIGMENTMQAYREWEEAQGAPGGVPDHVKQAFESATAQLEIRMPLEEMLGSPDTTDEVKFTAYNAYLKTEEATHDPSRITYMYERAVGELPKKEPLWVRYSTYVEEILKTPELIRSVCDRAARNCHGSGSMWARYIRAVERIGVPDSDIEDLYNTAMAHKLKGEEGYIAVILARCDSLRRQGKESMPRLREVFKEGQEKLLALNPEHCDPDLRIPAYQAHCEMEVAGDIEAARAVWEGALKASTGRLASTWQAFIAWERSKRNVQEARALYRRCYSRKLAGDGQVQICRDWLRFEREEGSAEDFFNARMKLEPILEELIPQQPKRLTPEDIRHMRQARDPNYRGSRDVVTVRSRQDDGNGSESQDDPPSKRAKVVTIERPSRTFGGTEYVAFVNQIPKFTKTVGLTKFFSGCPGLKDIRMPLDHATGKPRGIAYVEFDSQEGLDSALSLDGHWLDGAALSIKRSDRQSGLGMDAVEHVAFLRNLSWNTNENGLRQLFASCPGLKAIRIPLDHATGRVRGIAYVEFDSREGLEAALQFNGAIVDGRPVQIEESAPKSALVSTGRSRGGRSSYMGGRSAAPQYMDRGGGYGGGHSSYAADYGMGSYAQSGQYHMDPRAGPMSNDQFRHMFLG